METTGHPHDPRHPSSGSPAGTQADPSFAASGSSPVASPPLSPSSQTSVRDVAVAGGAGGTFSRSLQRIGGVPLTLRVTAGSGVITLGRVKGLAPGDMLVLDHAADAPFDLDCCGVSLGTVDVIARRTGLLARVVRLNDQDAD
ncbi:MAG: FliM/FliN family flagellar motor switch protein [Acidobacteriota bacterium]